MRYYTCLNWFHRGRRKKAQIKQAFIKRHLTAFKTKLET